MTTCLHLNEQISLLASGTCTNCGTTLLAVLQDQINELQTRVWYLEESVSELLHKSNIR